MYKRLILCLCLLTAISFIGCFQQRNNTENATDNGKNNLTIWAEIYKTTLESYLKQDTALNEDIDFIAIDLVTLEFANNYDKEAIVSFFEKNYVPIIDTNFEGLKAKGLFNEEGRYIPDGVLLTIDKVTKTENEIIIEGMKFRGGRAANWFETKWKLNDGIWEFNGTVMTFIS